MKQSPKDGLCVRCHKCLIFRKKWALCRRCYDTCRQNNTLFERDIYYLPKRKLEDTLIKKYGPEIVNDFELARTKPFWGLVDVSKKYNFSRERARQIFKRLYRIPFRSIQKKKTKLIQKEIARLNCFCDPLIKLAEYKKGTTIYKGARVEQMVREKCEKLKFDYEVLKQGNDVDCKINGHLVEIKSTATSHNHKSHHVKYFHVSLHKKQRYADFVICYIWPWKTFYVIPNHNNTSCICIRNGKPQRKIAGHTNHEEHKEAWHLLK